MFRAKLRVIELTLLLAVFESIQPIVPVPHSKYLEQHDWQDLENVHPHQGNPEMYLIVHPKVSREIIFEQPILLIHIDKWLLIFTKSDNLHFASNFKAEWIKANSTSSSDATKCSFKTGYIQGLESWSRAAVSICNTLLTGYFEMGNDSYFFEPFNDAHKLFKSQKKNNFPTRPVRAAHTDWLFNLTGDTIDIEENYGDFDISSDHSINESNDSRYENADTEIPLEYLRKAASGSYDEENGYFYDTAWSAVITEGGKTLPTRWLEIAVGVDHSLISFHGKDKVQQYVLALMNIVSAIYQDASLSANIKLVIARLLLYEHSKHGVVRPGNAKKSLENVNIWNRKLHAQLKPGQPRHDVAIWLTRSDIGGPSGYAPVGGVCDPKRSCALNKDEGLTSAFIIAHEMAHMLGLSHDGDKKARNDCEQDAADGSVMAAMVSATFSKFSWSKCSQREYKQKVGNWTCLFNAPRSNGEIPLNATLQTVFSMDEQCRMEFGEGTSSSYLMCRAFDIIEPCSHLWCGHKDSPLVCKTKKGPPLEGTECGFAKWCLNGYCSEIPQRPDQVPVLLNPQHGGWSEWSLWGPCSRSCGVGVQYRYRNCDNPKPSFGGKDCEGSNEDYRLCNKSACENQFVDLRAQQCEMLPRILNASFTSTSDTWLPYESLEEESKCKFSCMSDERKEILTLEENLPDGTPCSYEDEDKICIQGKCLLIGCDGQLSSTVVRDRCGTCGGDGSECNTTTILLRRKMKKEVKKIAVFPRMARHIQLEANVSFQDRSQKESPSIAFVLKNRKKRGYAVAIPNTVPNSKVVEGAHFFYRKDGGVHSIWAIGPVLAELLIMATKQALKGINVSANSQYSIHKDYMVPSTKFIWIIGGWGPCSRSCGGGKRQKTAACWDNQNAKLVKRKFCSLLEKPAMETETCNNFGCEFQWVAGGWEPCSATCGSLGMQSREVYCVPSAKSQGELEEVWRYMVSPRRCISSPPATSKHCNRFPCLYHWQYSQWSECSASCGTGISSRTAYCPALDDGTCGEPPPPQRQICAGNFTRSSNPLCKGRKLRECKQDESKYCGFNLLQRYCQLKGFRRLCCRSCAGFMEKNAKKHGFIIGSL
ncbi:hypothetical protein HUJ04_011892 [Dendroctonus ponderosae]|nr:hypothetical protein HUJ04_011892 [Dendroctonus ponderosae]